MLTTGSILPGCSGAPSISPDPRLKSAAHEFEASLMKEFLEPLQHDALFADEKDGGDSDDQTGEGSESALMSFGSEALARAISERGGFGIASRIIGHLEKTKKSVAKDTPQI